MKISVFLLVIGLFVYSCKPSMEDTIDIGPKPTLSFKKEMIGANRVRFTNTSSGTFLQKFDFGNGEATSAISFIAYYPWEGDYKVTLQGQGKGGTATSISETIHIASTDKDYSLCKDADIIKLTGGCDSINGKTWVLDRHSGFHCIGPIDAANDTTWYQEPHRMDPTGPEYNDCKFQASSTFKIRNFVYENKTSNPLSEFKYGYLYANAERGLNQPIYGDICLNYTPPHSSWSIDTAIVANRKTIKLSNGGFMILKEGTSNYEICYLSKDTLWVRWQFPEADPTTNPDLSKKHGYRYYRFVVKK